METQAQVMHIDLPERTLFELPDAAGMQIHCLAGSVWITLDHDKRDIVLEPAQCFTSPQHRRALLYALAPCRVSLRAPAPAPRRKPWWRRASPAVAAHWALSH